MARLKERLSQQRVRKKTRIWAVLAMLLIMLTVAAASYVWFISGGDFEKATKRVGSTLIGTGKVNILVMGVDERSGDVGRSDTLFVITVDKDTKAVSMLSVPRDTRVKIPGHGYDKINHAYAEGGHKLSMKAVEELLDIPIDYYVLVNFSGFVNIVDALGGIDINVEKRMYYEDPYDDKGLVINLRPGLQHMDGKTAIQYVRYRDEEGDIGRVKRQQKFVKALMDEAASPAVITKVPALISELSSAIKTDMSVNEMLNLAKLLNDASKQGLHATMVPGRPAYIDDVSYWIPDIAALRKHMAALLDIQAGDRYLVDAKRTAAEYENSIPKEMTVLDPPPKTAEELEQEKEEQKKEDKERDKAANRENEKDRDNRKDKIRDKPVLPPPAKISVKVLNASGVASAGDKMASLLKAQGFQVSGVSNMTSTYKTTTVVANTANSAVVDKLSNLPFQYSLQVENDDNKNSQATVIVGRDFAGK
ncbi:hypothetical protein P22_1824 [Propionispora sp. 2/2-37]|uniref:LCP family protein n=1 Tax=Propionispora sp. 2/2-37 TaxID=1677858 RepID=UPI0006BB53FC|nr:LCP family protein [Propionispora sp. 2/2-37]CUH95744.1 hypothetical protein P22_1824 [Propionispora sp. 2/2-37]